MRNKKQPPQFESWQSVHGIATHLGISKETIYRLLKRKKIPCHRLGKLWLFSQSEIDAWVKSKKRSY